MSERLQVTVEGVRLVCHVSGAPALVLLHGLGDDGGTWEVVGAEFAQYFRVLAIDLRGHGLSDWPGTYSFELMRDDVLGVLDELGLDRVNLLGHSMGGTVAYLIAEREPGRIERLILEDAAARLPRGTLRVIPAGHHVHAALPAEFTAAVLGFLLA